MNESSAGKNVRDTCFVLSPFKEPFNDDYRKILRPAITDAGLSPLRADEIYGAKSIMSDIWKSIQSAKILLAEMTGRNPNVLYEVGLAHAIGKPVVMITQSKKDIPFDLNPIRYISYQRIKPDWAKVLRSEIKENLLATLQEDRRVFPDEEPFSSIANPKASWLPDELHHVSLPVRDLKKSVKFYRDTLGLQTIKRPPLFKFAGAWFKLPSGQQLHLLVNSDGTFRDKPLDYRDCHFALRVRNFVEARQRLKKKIKDMVDNPTLLRQYPHFYILDPDGHIIEINAEKYHEPLIENV